MTRIGLVYDDDVYNVANTGGAPGGA